MIRKAINLAPLALKQLVRHRVRTSLTLVGIAAGMFLFAVVENMQRSVGAATTSTATDVTLVVFRENRFCPSTSRLPLYYGDEISRIEGVIEAIPVQITVNNCRASLDIITFRGVPPELLTRYAPDLEVVAGTLSDWMNTDDGALVGEHLARRRGLGPGDAFDAAGVRVRVSGVIRSPNAQDNAVAYVHLPFLQQASRSGLGEVTQFNVRVNDMARMDAVSAEIDALFATSAIPTYTQPEKAFFARAAQELVELIGFTRWIGMGAVIAVLGMIGNTILLVVRSRVKENAILQTLGYSGRDIGFLVVLEGILLGLAGGMLGLGAANLVLHFATITFGNEGQLMTVLPQSAVLIQGVLLCLGLGALASLAPAYTAARQPIVESLES